MRSDTLWCGAAEGDVEKALMNDEALYGRVEKSDAVGLNVYLYA